MCIFEHPPYIEDLVKSSCVKGYRLPLVPPMQPCPSRMVWQKWIRGWGHVHLVACGWHVQTMFGHAKWPCVPVYPSWWHPQGSLEEYGLPQKALHDLGLPRALTAKP